MVYTLLFVSSKCSLFHNSNLFGSCIIHILYTGCAKIKKKFRGQKVKQSMTSLRLLSRKSFLLDNWRQKNRTQKADKIFSRWHSVRDVRTRSPYRVFVLFWLRKDRLKSPFLDTVCFTVLGLRSFATVRDHSSWPHTETRAATSLWSLPNFKRDHSQSLSRSRQHPADRCQHL